MEKIIKNSQGIYATNEDGKNDYKIMRVVADIHPDGDVYIKVGKGFERIGKLGESDFGHVPDPYYSKIRKWLRK